MSKYGIDNVRGEFYSQIELNEEIKTLLTKEIYSLPNDKNDNSDIRTNNSIRSNFFTTPQDVNAFYYDVYYFHFEAGDLNLWRRYVINQIKTTREL